MNFIAIANFFYIIYNAIFRFLFDISQTIIGIFGPIFNYFAIDKINGDKMLHLLELESKQKGNYNIINQIII